jgi:dTDP-4-amino-4,6-dideoxygalactose transaminase
MTLDQDFIDSLPRLTFYRGRVALYAILRALGVGPGDSVVTQAFTCSAVPEAIIAAGARPAFADVAPGSVNAGAAELEAKCDETTKAVIVQHTFGIPCEMGPVMEFTGKRGLPVVEDCCHTFASRLRGVPVGSFGVAAFTSYEWGKPVVCGLGGSAFVRDRELYSRVETVWRGLPYPSPKQLLKVEVQYKAFRALYRPSRYWKLKRAFRRLSERGMAEGNYSAPGEVAEGFALRMAPKLVERLKATLPGAGRIVEHQAWVAQHYQGQVHSTRIEPVAVPEGAEVAYARYPLLVDDKPALLARAEEADVELADWYTSPIQPLGPADFPKVGYTFGSCPNAEALSKRIVSLPTNLRVGIEDVDRAIELLSGY